jgi:hypothetical protein
MNETRRGNAVILVLQQELQRTRELAEKLSGEWIIRMEERDRDVVIYARENPLITPVTPSSGERALMNITANWIVTVKYSTTFIIGMPEPMKRMFAAYFPDFTLGYERIMGVELNENGVWHEFNKIAVQTVTNTYWKGSMHCGFETMDLSFDLCMNIIVRCMAKFENIVKYKNIP